jgi:nucleoid-associated protein YgaU
MLCGVVLAGVGLLWVVTRPTLTTQARMVSPSAATSQESRPQTESLFSEPSRPAAASAAPERPTQVAEASPVTGLVETVRPEPSVNVPPTQTRVPQPDLTVHEREQKITTTRFHIVQKDETLSSISQQYYGTASRWQKILAANEQTIKDANKIRPGTKLIIPE